MVSVISPAITVLKKSKNSHILVFILLVIISKTRKSFRGVASSYFKTIEQISIIQTKLNSRLKEILNVSFLLFFQYQNLIPQEHVLAEGSVYNLIMSKIQPFISLTCHSKT